jgi:hypothetical protein
MPTRRSPVSRPLACLTLVLLAGVASAQRTPGASLPPPPAPDAPGEVLRAYDALLPVTRYDGHRVVEVLAWNPRDAMAVMALATTVWTHSPRPGPLEVQVDPAQFAALQELCAARGLPLRVVVEDVQRAIDAERAEVLRRGQIDELAWYQNYRTYDEFNARLGAMATLYPQMATTFTAGQTLQGRAMNGMVISGPSVPGNAAADRPQIFLHGGQHAREWVSPMVTMFIGEHLLERYATDARVRAVMDRVQFIIVPVMNVDGYLFTWSNDRLWRKNRRPNGDGSFGVDNNRNWGYGWGGQGASTVPSNDTYRGPAPFSEPETQVMRDVVLNNPRIRLAIDFHSYSQIILSPWGWTQTLPPDHPTFASLNAAQQQAIRDYSGLTYTAGPVFTAIYPASGGALDWYYGARLDANPLVPLYGYSYELRPASANPGFILPPDQIIPNGEEVFRAMLVLGEFVGLPLRISFPAGQPATVSTSQTTTVRVQIENGAGVLASGSGELLYRVGTVGSLSSAPLTSAGGNLFEASLPPVPCGQTLQWYVRASTTQGQNVFAPADAPATLFSAVGLESVTTYEDLANSNPPAPLNWTVGAPGDNATSGIWENAVPGQTAAQPGAGFTGTRAWVTGAAAGSGVGANDVDGGTTTLTSPRFSALPESPLSDAQVRISYARWYSNNQGANPGTNSMPVLISNDDGATWTQLELVTENAGRWVQVSLPLPAGMAPTANMRLRFQARDLTGAVVEAGVDDVRAVVTGCPACRADFNNDGELTFDDIQAFVGAYNAQQAVADFNSDGEWTFDDIQLFVSAYNAGC